tara:strand:+ start:1777 stop:2613 length:837 start_codon:yes stop_codon:yes gene_type:complete
MESLNFLDAHAHVNFPVYDEDREGVLSRAREANVSMINVGTQKNTSVSAVKLAEEHDEGVYATVGVHPIHAGGSEYHDKKELKKEEFKPVNFEWDYDFYKKLAANKKVVAIGECGLDYFRCDEKTKESQKDIFISQIHLANETDMPLMLHIRSSGRSDDAYLDTISILKSESKVRGNFHFFAGSLETAKKIWDIGYTTSFTGVITFTNDYDEIVREAPEGLLMSETDCPYVAPVPYRGKRNEPAYVTETVKRIAKIREKPISDISHTIMNTAKDLFGI